MINKSNFYLYAVMILGQNLNASQNINFFTKIDGNIQKPLCYFVFENHYKSDMYKVNEQFSHEDIHLIRKAAIEKYQVDYNLSSTNNIHFRNVVNTGIMLSHPLKPTRLIVLNQEN